MTMYEEHAGRLAGRFLKALAIAKGDVRGALGFVEGQARWNDDRKELTKALMVQKVGIGAIAVGGSALELVDVGVSFLGALRPLDIASRLTVARTAPAFTRLVGFGLGATGYSNLGEGMPIPVTRLSTSAMVLKPTKTAALLVVSGELLKLSSTGSETAITTDLAAAVGAAEDEAFLSPTMPGSVLYGAASVPSSGSNYTAIDADLRASLTLLIAAKSTLLNVVVVMSPSTATSLSLMRTPSGEPAYEDVTVRGGTIGGLPILISAGVSGYIGLIDQDGIVLDEAPRVALDLSEDAAFEMSDTPGENSVTPTPAQVVSMFQTNSVAFRSVLYRAWATTRPGLTAFISGVSY